MRFLLFSWFLLFHCVFVFIGSDKIWVDCQCLEDQSSLLLQFKQSLSFHPSSVDSKLMSWNSSTDCCSWEGVTCDGVAGHVIGLDLSSELIRGTIDNSSSLFNLRYLEYLNLAYNKFHFSTSRFDELLSLTNLNLSSSGLSGIIPIEISRLTRLVSLDLSVFPFDAFDDDQYYEEIDPVEAQDLRQLVRNLTGLTTLRLDGVNISAKGSEWCQALSSALPNLQVLSLSHCQLSGPIHSSLSKLRFLSQINLDNNDISSEVPQFFASFLNLTSLNLSWCGLTGTFPEKIFQLTALETLDLSFNHFYVSLPEFPRNGSLRNLVLSSTNFSGYLPESIGNLMFLSKLEISICGLNELILSSNANFTQLVYLDLSYNNLEGSIPSWIMNLTQLVYLDLSRNSFNGSIPFSIVNLAHLVYLDLSLNSLTGSIPLLPDNLTQINLAYNYLSGPIPLLPENLAEIKLPHNSLTGSLISSHWKRLLKLVNLDLTDNSLNGTIPSCLFTLPSLQKLQLGYNQLTGQLLEFSNVSLAPVDTLDLSSNELEGPIPISIFELSRLEVLNLSFNNFSGIVQFGMIQKFGNLSTLDLSYNSLSVNTSVNNSTLFSLPKMTKLHLASCKLRVFPDFLRISQPQLSDLDLSNNQIQGKIPTWVWRIGNNHLLYLNLSCNFLVDVERPLPVLPLDNWLDILDLHSNLLQGPIPILSGVSPTYLDYSRNRFNSSIPANIANFPYKILFFSLARNNLTGEIPSSICDANSLRVLDLSINSLSGSIPSCLSDNWYLRVLNLRHNNFSGTLPLNYLYGCGLRMLDLSANRLEGKVSTTLANCIELEILDLGNNQINDTFPISLGKLSQLRVLVLRSNRFYGSIKNHGTTNYTFPMLQIIDLSSNNFTGNLPTTIFSSLKSMMVNKEKIQTEVKLEIEVPGNNDYVVEYNHQASVRLISKGLKMELVKILGVFKYIDFSNNDFQGDIPEVMGNLTLLYSLNLSHNSLIGRIPSSLGNLRELESLDLSQNKLTGKIPSQLTSLTFLSSLNLSHNKLEGLIPRGSQFQTFTEASFEGNEGLCGLPLSRNCMEDEAPSPKSSFERTGSKSVVGYDWHFLLSGLVMGFGLGAGTSIAFFLFSKKGRKWLLARPRS